MRCLAGVRLNWCPPSPGGAPLRRRSLAHHEDTPVAVPVNAPELEVCLGLHGRCPGGAIDEGQLPKAPAFTDAGHPLSVHVHLQGSGDSVGGLGSPALCPHTPAGHGDWGLRSLCHLLHGEPSTAPPGGRRSLHPQCLTGGGTQLCSALPRTSQGAHLTPRPAQTKAGQAQRWGCRRCRPRPGPRGCTTRTPTSQARPHSAPHQLEMATCWAPGRGPPHQASPCRDAHAPPRRPLQPSRLIHKLPSCP